MNKILKLLNIGQKLKKQKNFFELKKNNQNKQKEYCSSW